MRTLKILGMITLVFFSYLSEAQIGEKSIKTPEERAKNQTKAITKVCSLSDEQQIKVEQLILNSIIKLDEIRSAKPTQRGEKMKDLQAIKEKQNTEIKQILTPEQFVKYQELVEKQKEKLQDRRMEKRREIMESAE